ncbi:unnamed protein product [Brassica rapa]|uniref:Uncharacterized protein n=1 Tax=Brassica campestris TaxID=3711 RepID=A0A3P5Y7F9_BRACM|nr:unnamed protein product [Brassica rapa]VDC63289.1 unnamed protein product [Brassica rapa]
MAASSALLSDLKARGVSAQQSLQRKNAKNKGFM